MSSFVVWRSKDLWTGLLLIAVGVLGLILSRDYPIGTIGRMGTGYVPRLLCWMLIGLGGVIGLRGLLGALRQRGPRMDGTVPWRPVVLVTVGIVLFALSLERLGLVIAIALLSGVSALAGRELKPMETLAAGLVLIGLSWSVFVLGLGVTVPVWPEW